MPNAELAEAMLELRASARLAKIMVRRHDAQEARRILASVLDKLDEGVDGGDLRAALAFLREIS